jgi:hypothetical protein
MTTNALQSSEFDPFYGRYIHTLDADLNLRDGFELGKKEVLSFFRNIPEHKHSFRYAPEKWSIKEILQHLIDAERVFLYRCFRIARMDRTPLAGFDQDSYIEPSGADHKTMDALLYEYEINRNNSIALLNSLTDAHLAFVGNSNGSPMSARAAAFSVIGHEICHMEVIKEKYL